MPKFQITRPVKLIKGVLHLAEEEIEHIKELIESGSLKRIDEPELPAESGKPAADPAPQEPAAAAPQEPAAAAPKPAKGKAE
jgi:hypothetical protein